MHVGEDYQSMVSENLALANVPGNRQMLPMFTTSLNTATNAGNSTQYGTSGNPAAVQMTKIYDFSQGEITPSGSPYHVAIQGQGFFEVKEADGSITYTRNGNFNVSPTGQLRTSDGATVAGSSGSPISINVADGNAISIGEDGTVSQGANVIGKLGLAHFDNPTASLSGTAYGRFTANNASDVKQGPASNDKVLQNSLESSNGNPVEQMTNMIQAMRLYEMNQKSIQASDDNQNQLINTLGGHAQA